jgi:aminocarboxymuconate-semialdehyde decarboxylase
MSATPTIDVHAHILPQETIRLLGKQSPRVAPKLIAQADGSLNMVIGGKLVQRPMPQAAVDLAQRLRDMDANGIGMQLVCPTVHTFFYDQEGALGAACAALQNEQIAAMVKSHPDRFMGLATLPMQDPRNAAIELSRAMRTLGLCGALIGTHVNGRNLDDPAFDPVWTMANELCAFVLIHPHGEILPGDRLKFYHLRNSVGFPFETTIAGAALVFSGVVERYPNIAFCLTYGGGFVPYQLGRLLHAYKVRPDAMIRLQGAPENAIRKLYYDTIVHSARALEFLVDTVGADHVLLGSDYPFDMGNLDCVARVRATALAPEVQAAVLGGSARELLRAGQALL